MKIKDICEIRIGHAFRRRLSGVPDGKVTVIQPKNISGDGSLIFDQGGPLRMNVSAPKPLQPDDVLVVNRGRFAAAVFDLPDVKPWIVPASILVLTMKTESVLPAYVACYFNSPCGQRLFRRHCEETTVPFVSAGNLGKMDIPIPPPDRQRTLVALDTAAANYARLSERKQHLLRQILNTQLDYTVHTAIKE